MTDDPLAPDEREFFDWLTAPSRRGMPAPRLVGEFARASQIDDAAQREEALATLLNGAMDICLRAHGMPGRPTTQVADAAG